MASKGIDLSNCDWDDTELIAAYDRSIAERDGIFSDSEKDKRNKKKHNYERKNTSQWHEGNYCKAPYSGDGEYYEAKIVTVSGDTCTVHFIGYGDDVEEVYLSDLKRTHGSSARVLQSQEAVKSAARKEKEAPLSSETSQTEVSESETTDLSNRNHHGAGRRGRDRHPRDARYPRERPAVGNYYGRPYVPPRANMPFVPPPMPDLGSSSLDGSLHSLLVSWYIAGYQMGLMEGKEKEMRKQSSCCCHHQ